MEPARDPATEHMDARLNERSHEWQALLRSVPAAVRARVHVIADQHPDADPWGILSHLAIRGM
jgi:putative heme iron utilization protein